VGGGRGFGFFFFFYNLEKEKREKIYQSLFQPMRKDGKYHGKNDWLAGSLTTTWGRCCKSFHLNKGKNIQNQGAKEGGRSLKCLQTNLLPGGGGEWKGG